MKELFQELEKNLSKQKESKKCLIESQSIKGIVYVENLYINAQEKKGSDFLGSFLSLVEKGDKKKKSLLVEKPRGRPPGSKRKQVRKKPIQEPVVETVFVENKK